LTHQPPAAESETAVLRAEIRRLRKMALHFPDRTLMRKIGAVIAAMEKRLEEICDVTD